MAILAIRLAFAFVVLFEALNYFHIFNDPLVYSWAGLVSTVCFVWVAMEYSHRKGRHHSASWVLAFAIVFFDAGGDVLGFYRIIPHYDKYVHALSSGLCAVILLIWYMRRSVRVTLLDYWHAWAITFAFGALYELEEYWESVWLMNNRWGGGIDSMTDMSANGGGALALLLVAAIVLTVRLRHRTPQLLLVAPRAPR